jgi:hypothetical protein
MDCMKGRIGSSMSMERKAMRAYYKAAAEASRAHANRNKRSALGRRTGVVIVPPRSKAA